MKGRLVAGFALGFIVGVGAGFLYGRQAKSRVGESISTSFHRGKLTIEADIAKAGLGFSL